MDGYLAPMSSILVIEDDPAIRSAVQRAMTERGHAVAVASGGLPGLEVVINDRPDVVMLDLGLPDVDGLTMIPMIRAASAVPIIVITARDDDATIVRALDGGADDYVVKPFGADQVAARIRAVLRRGGVPASYEPIRVGDLVIDERSRTVTLAGRAARAGPQGVRPAARARPATGRGRHQARAAGRGVAAGVRRLRPHRRRAPVVAAAQARRDGGRAALPGQRPWCRGTAGGPGRRLMRSRISWLVLATTSAIVMAFVIPLCLLVRTLAADRAMSAADQAARNVALVVTSVPDTAQLDGYLADLNRSIVPQVSVLTPAGRSLGTTDDLSQDPDVRKALTGEGLRVTRDDSGAVLLPVVGEHGTTVVRASVTGADLQRGVLPAWFGIIALGLVLIALGWVIARQLGRRISEPLRGVAQTAHQLREGDLSARAEVGGTPETVELAQALNGLAERTGELLAAERAAVGDLSHRLRTPVTALRLDAESVVGPRRGATAPGPHHRAAADRRPDRQGGPATRPEHPGRPLRRGRHDRRPGGLLVGARRGRRPGAPRRHRDGRRCWSRCPPSDLADLLDVLIDNVFAHTPDGTGFAVTLHAGGGTCVLSVSDDGAGWSAEREARSRPHRARPRHRTSYGSGLRRSPGHRHHRHRRGEGRGGAAARRPERSVVAAAVVITAAVVPWCVPPSSLEGDAVGWLGACAWPGRRRGRRGRRRRGRSGARRAGRR